MFQRIRYNIYIYCGQCRGAARGSGMNGRSADEICFQDINLQTLRLKPDMKPKVSLESKILRKNRGLKKKHTKTLNETLDKP